MILLTTLSVVLGCNSSAHDGSYVLTKKERAICSSMQIDTSLIKDIRDYNANEIEPFHYSLAKKVTKDTLIEIDPIHLNGLVIQEKNSRSYELVFALKNRFMRKGYTIFLLENNFNSGNSPDYVGVLPTTDKFTVLKHIGTDGVNWDISNDSLLKIIKRFDDRYSLELIGASGEWCEFIIHKEPNDWMEFAKDVYNVCPDVVEQGAGSIEALANEYKMTRRLYLWWD
ncbi:MAG: DUF4253 domain-containing protein [Bacteroidetes bacterium]|nr:DUF4253 domain-containing protein [Bacteroidota bacterium]